MYTHTHSHTNTHTHIHTNHWRCIRLKPRTLLCMKSLCIYIKAHTLHFLCKCTQPCPLYIFDSHHIPAAYPKNHSAYIWNHTHYIFSANIHEVTSSAYGCLIFRCICICMQSLCIFMESLILISHQIKRVDHSLYIHTLIQHTYIPYKNESPNKSPHNVVNGSQKSVFRPPVCVCACVWVCAYELVREKGIACVCVCIQKK